MKTKRISFLKGILSAVFMLALMITVFTVMPVTASATNVSEVVYASNLVDGDDIVLIGDTTLYVNADVSLKSIKGDYALEIQSDGEHTLTIDNPNGSAIYVKTLKSVKPSQGTVNLTIKGGDDYFAIATTSDISLDGIKLDVKSGAGIRSEEGNVTINGTSVSVVGNDGVGVIANGGSIMPWSRKSWALIFRSPGPIIRMLTPSVSVRYSRAVMIMICSAVTASPSPSAIRECSMT